MAFPLLFISLAFVSGILAATTPGVPLRAALPAMIVCLAAAWIFYAAKRNKAAFGLLLAATVFLGTSLTQFRTRQYDENMLRRFAFDGYADFSGTLLRSPSPTADRDVLRLKVDHVRAGGEIRILEGRLQISVPRSPEVPRRVDLAAGDRLTVSARVTPPRDADNFRPPFSPRYLRSRNIHNRAFAKSPLLIEKTAQGGDWNPVRRISILRQKLQRSLERYFPKPLPAGISAEGAVLEALLLGEDGRLDAATAETLQKTGLYHLFAISGAHVAIVSFLFFSIFKLFRIPRKPSYLLLIAGLIFYALLVEGRPSVMRAILMTLTYLTGKLLWKDVHLLNTLSLSALLILLWNPFSLYDAGFQLTFAATFSIILFTPRLLKLLPSLPFKIGELTAVSVAAFIGVLPIIVHSFNRVAFSSLVLNYAAVPLIGLVMVVGYVFLPISLAVPFLAKPMAFSLTEIVRLFSWISRLFDPVRFMSYRIPTPPDAVIAAYYAFLLLFLLPIRIKHRKPIAIAGFAAAFLILITYPFPSNSAEFKVTVIDVGQGDSILIEFPGHRKMLIDGGGIPEGTFDVGERVVSPFLWRKGIKTIDILVMTHAHPDHLNGLPAIAKNFRIGEFWEAGRTAKNPSYARLIDSLDPRAPRKAVARGFARTIDGVSVDVLNPPAEASASAESARRSENDGSIVLRFAYGQATVLLAGDIGAAAEEEILNSLPGVRSRVLKAAHHGSDTSSSMDFLRRVSPEIVIISAGAGNRYGFPQPPVLERCAQIGARICRTDIDGAVEVASDGRILRVRTSAASSGD